MNFWQIDLHFNYIQISLFNYVFYSETIVNFWLLWYHMYKNTQNFK